MTVKVKFWSYFSDLTENRETTLELAEGTTLGELHSMVLKQFPKLAKMKNSTLKAVGVEYQNDNYVLNDGDEVAFYPPVTGG